MKYGSAQSLAGILSQGKRCSIGRAPIILNQLKSIEINVLRQHWSCTVQCTSLEEPFDRLVPAFDYGNFHSAICLPFCLKRTTSYIKFTKLIRIEFKQLVLQTSITAVSEFLPLNSQSSVSVLEVFDSSLKHCTAQADPNYNGHSVATRRIIVLAWTHHQGPPFLHYT